MAQISAIELHAWGATEADPLHPDQAVFDLDPGEGVAFTDVVQAAHDVRDQLQRLKLESFCRTTGGKGLHVVVPLDPAADWDTVKPFCRAFAETMSNEQPDRYLPTMKKADRRGKILIDWLRNGLGATAVASFCPRARPGATVAMPLAWDAVNRQARSCEVHVAERAGSTASPAQRSMGGLWHHASTPAEFDRRDAERGTPQLSCGQVHHCHGEAAEAASMKATEHGNGIRVRSGWYADRHRRIGIVGLFTNMPERADRLLRLHAEAYQCTRRRSNRCLAHASCYNIYRIRQFLARSRPAAEWRRRG